MTAQAQDDDAELVEQIISAWAFAHNIDGAARNDLFSRLRIAARLSVTTPDTTVLVELPPEAFCVLDEMTDEVAFSAATIATRASIPEARVREWHRAFKLLGLAEFGTLHDLDGEGLRGRGYWLNDKGDKLRHALASTANPTGAE